MTLVCSRTTQTGHGSRQIYFTTQTFNRYMGVVQKSFHYVPGLSQDLREAFASFRAWGFTTVGENGFSLGLEAFKDSCKCPGTSCVL